MSMHNGMDIGTQFVNEQMHGDLGGNLATSVESQAIHANDHQIVLRHVTFTDGCGCCENGAIVQPDADVPIISRNKSSSIDTSTNLNNVFAVLL
jgi:hypothetical protein